MISDNVIVSYGLCCGFKNIFCFSYYIMEVEIGDISFYYGKFRIMFMVYFFIMENLINFINFFYVIND